MKSQWIAGTYQVDTLSGRCTAHGFMWHCWAIGSGGGRCSLTHNLTGMSLAHALHPETAARIAERVDGLTDWSAITPDNRDQLRGTVGKQVRAILDEERAREAEA